MTTLNEPAGALADLSAVRSATRLNVARSNLDGQELAAMCSTAQEERDTNLFPVWLGATPNEAHWCDWAHQVAMHMERLGLQREVTAAWTRAAAKSSPAALWLVWQEVVTALRQSQRDARLLTFIPGPQRNEPTEAGLETQRKVFIDSWTRLLPATLVLGAGEHSTRIESTLRDSFHDLSDEIATSAPSASESSKKAAYLPSLAAVLRSFDVDADDALRFAAAYVGAAPEAALFQPNLLAGCLKRWIGRPPRWFRKARRATTGIPATPGDAEQRARWALRLAFLRLLATFDKESQCVIEACRRRDGYKDLYLWQERPALKSDAEQALVMGVLHSEPPTDPPVPRFEDEMDARRFWARFREAILVELQGTGTAVVPEEAADTDLNKTLVGCFAGTTEVVNPEVEDILTKLDKVQDASDAQRRRALLLLADLGIGSTQFSEKCWRRLAKRTQGQVPDMDAIAAEIMLGQIKDEDTLDERIADMDDESKERLRLRFWAKTGNSKQLRVESERKPTGRLPTDILRCIYAWCLTEYVPEKAAAREAKVELRMMDAFRINAVESLIRFRQNLRMGMYSDEVTPHVKSTVFFSYRAASKEDGGGRQATFELANALSKHYTVFTDRSLASGDDWSERILQELFSARIVIAVHSKGYESSAWCRVERRIARMKQRHRRDKTHFIAIVLDDTTINDDPAEPLVDTLRATVLTARTGADGSLLHRDSVIARLLADIEAQTGIGKSQRDAVGYLEMLGSRPPMML